MTVSERNNYYITVIIIVSSFITVIGVITGAILPESIAQLVYRPVCYVMNMAVIIIVSIILYKFFRFALLNNMFKHGLKYALKHNTIQKTIVKELIRCEVYLHKDKAGIYTPIDVLMKLKKDFSGYIFIRDLPKYHSKLESLQFSSVLPDFLICENQYMNDSHTHWILEVCNFELKPLVIDSVDKLREIAKADKYKLAITDTLSVPIHHTLLIGQTGSGKSYSLIYIILSLICKNADIYVCDPKQSDIAVCAEELLSSKEYYASEVMDIINLIEKVGNVLKERQSIMQELLKSSDVIACDYRDFGLNPVVLVIDEFSAFILALPKKEHDIVMNVLQSLVLKGRQCGLFLAIAQQQTNAKNLPTELRENIPLKIILGNSGRETYTTALGKVPEASKRRFGVGQALLVYPGISTEENPKVVAMPLLTENVLSKQGIRALKESVIRDSDSDSVT